MAKIVTWPQSQKLAEYAGYAANCTLISSEYGLAKYGPCAYIVEDDWYEDCVAGRLGPISDEESAAALGELGVDCGFSEEDDKELEAA